MAAGKDFVTGFDDQLAMFVFETPSGTVRLGGGFFQRGISRNHFPWHQVFSDAEVLQRALGLRAPEFLRGDLYFAEAVAFFANFPRVAVNGIRAHACLRAHAVPRPSSQYKMPQAWGKSRSWPFSGGARWTPHAEAP